MNTRWRLVLTLALPVAFVLLVCGVQNPEHLLKTDEAINGFFASYRDSRALAVSLWVTALGSNPTVTAVCVTATGFLWIGRRLDLAAGLWTSFLGAEITSWMVKYAIGRVRPQFLESITATSPSFPSGHTTSAMAVYGFLALVLASQASARYRPAICLLILILLIAFSRIFLSLHYLSDVVGGLLVGGFWLLVGSGLARTSQR